MLNLKATWADARTNGADILSRVPISSVGSGMLILSSFALRTHLLHICSWWIIS